MCKVSLVVVVSLLVLSSLGSSTVAYRNAPDGINSETPDKPKFYNFWERITHNFMLSHYSTHDWIADAALRLLLEESPDGYNDWKWLLKDLHDPRPKWRNYYGNGRKHYAIRSYITYLFATQMPDMDPDDENKPRPNKNPIKIDLRGFEGEVIGDGFYGSGSWVGQTNYHTLHFYAKSLGGGQYVMIPKPLSNVSPQKAPWYAWKMSQAAINCLNHKEKNNDGELESWAKPEAAASWFGVMTHYIADLASPAHLIHAGEGYYPVSPKFHDWFEIQLSKFTVWDSVVGGPAGYYSPNFFKIDLSIIGENRYLIKSIPPYTAAGKTAFYSLRRSYGHIDEGGLFIKKGDDVQETLMKNWVWGDPRKERNNNLPILGTGLTYKGYYDKVEYLLNTAIYYTAAALKWSINELKKENNNEIVVDNWAKTPFYLKHPEMRLPETNKDKIDDSEESNIIRKDYKKLRVFVMAAMLIPSLALAYLPKLIKSVLK